MGTIIYKICAETGSSKIKNEGLHTEKRFEIKLRFLRSAMSHRLPFTFGIAPERDCTSIRCFWSSCEAISTVAKRRLEARSFHKKK